MSLPEQIQKIKGFFRSREEKVLTSLQVFLVVGVGVGGYFIGAIAPGTPQENREGGIAVFSSDTQELPAFTHKSAFTESAENSQEKDPATTKNGAFVASSKGTKYHRLDCSGAKTIKEENRVYFSSEQAAKEAGYAPAGNCSGLK